MSEAETDTTELTAHEFRAELPCEHPRHRGPLASATWVQRCVCPRCHRARSWPICDACKGRLLAAAVFSCLFCDEGSDPADWHLTFDPIPEATP